MNKKRADVDIKDIIIWIIMVAIATFALVSIIRSVT